MPASAQSSPVVPGAYDARFVRFFAWYVRRMFAGKFHAFRIATGTRQVLASLAEYIESCGGTAEMVTGWFTKTEFRKDGATAGTSYAYYFDTQVSRKRRRRGRVLAHCPACSP